GTNNSGVHRNGPTRGVTPSAVPGSNAAIGYLGVDAQAPVSPEDIAGDVTYSVRASSRPTTFSIETWFKTTTTSGGKLVGFGDRQERPSVRYDEHIYMTNSGSLVFGVSGAPTAGIISSAPGLNDGKWHHVVATQGPGGMGLFVDGKSQATSPAVPKGVDYTGYWHVGGDSVGSWPSAPSSPYFNGQIDETAIYPSALSPAQVAQHYTIGNQRTP
ncbi:LamG domain-containing protein, partial [Streptomyces sp. NPDC093982]|uniref:LamG domain-containing protein n=1 Tax=Streptomyces sp. NPDC093982 TaxID=3155077 RepID=UPI0034280192